MEIIINNIGGVDYDHFKIHLNQVNIINSRTLARATYAALKSLHNATETINDAVRCYGKPLPDFITHEQINSMLIQGNFEQEFSGQISNLCNMEQGLVTVNEAKFTVTDNMVKLSNPFNVKQLPIYINDYNPNNYHIKELLKMKGSVVDTIINDEEFGHIFNKLGIGNYELTLTQANSFAVLIPHTKDPLKICNVSESILPFITLKHLLYNCSSLLYNCILILKQPPLNQAAFKELITLLNSKYKTTVIINS